MRHKRRWTRTPRATTRHACTECVWCRSCPNYIANTAHTKFEELLDDIVAENVGAQFNGVFDHLVKHFLHRADQKQTTLFKSKLNWTTRDETKDKPVLAEMKPISSLTWFILHVHSNAIYKKKKTFGSQLENRDIAYKSVPPALVSECSTFADRLVSNWNDKGDLRVEQKLCCAHSWIDDPSHTFKNQMLHTFTLTPYKRCYWSRF